MALTFPTPTTVGETHSEAGRTWSWSGTAWQVVSGYAAASHTHPLSQLEQSSAADGQVPVWDATTSAWVPQTPASYGLPFSTSSYIIAKPEDDLAAKYTAAKALTPNGAALSATNRASLIIFPGSYTLSVELAIDTEFVDVVGLGAQTQTPIVFVNGNTLNVSANDVRVTGISVGSQNFKIAGSKPLQVFENCTGGDFSFGGGGTASGAFINCTGEYGSFGGGGIASGTFTGCTGGVQSFGGEGTSSGTFTDCNGGDFSFGGNGGIVSGTFTDCNGGDFSFGGDGGIASGTFTNCAGGSSSFGSSGTATGTFTNCTGGENSFGYQGNASGTFTNCIAGSNSFGVGAGRAANGIFTNCTGGICSFGCDGIASGTFIDCTAGNISFGGFGAANGIFTNCTGGENSFGGSLGTAKGTFTSCRLTSGTFIELTAPSTGKARMTNCIDGNGNIIEGEA